MNKRLWFTRVIAVTAVLQFAGSSYAVTPDDALINSKISSSKFSTFVFGRLVERDVNLDDAGVAALKANQLMVGVGYDIASWFTASLAAGGTEAKLNGLSSYDQYRPSCLLKFNANIWNIVMKPVRVSLRGLAEFSQQGIGSDSELDWQEFFGAGLIQLDLYPSDKVAAALNAERLTLYAGPAYSSVRGTWDHGANKQDFDEDTSFGALAGLDMHLTESVALGAQARGFSASDSGYNATWIGSLTYHF